MDFRNTKIIAMGMLLMAASGVFVFSGCQQKGAGDVKRDSTEIRRIEDMQRRGSDLRNISKFEEAIAVHDSCIQMAQKINDTVQWVIALNNQGTNFRRLGALKEASDYHYKALALCDAYSDTTTYDAKKNRVRSLNGLGNIFMSIGNNEAAEKFFRQALNGEALLGSATGQAINLANIGSIKQHEGQLDSARIYYTQSMEKNREDDNQVGICLCYTYLGELDEKEGKIHESTDNFRKSFEVGKATDDAWHWLTPCISLAENFLMLHQPDSAQKYIMIGVEAAENIHSNEHLAEIYSLRSQLEELKGETPMALKDLQRSDAFRDSLTNEENRNSIENSRVNYETNRSTAVVKAAEDEARVNRIVRNLTICICVLIVISLFIWWRFVRRAMNIRRKATQEREQFYRNVTHQLRTPLTVVLGMMEQLTRHIPQSDKEGQEGLDAAKRQGRHLLELVKELIRGAKEGFQTDIANGNDNAGDSESHNISNGTEAKAASLHSATEIKQGASILLAEDNEDVAILMCSILRENGYNVVHAADGQEALDILSYELPDLLITDIAMPRMDGLELMRHVRENDEMNHLPIMVVSARVEDSERLEGISAGAEVYLAKPFINEELLLRVKKLLEQRERLRQKFSAAAIAPAEHAAEKKEDKENSKEKDFLDELNGLIATNLGSSELNSAFLADKMCMSVSTLNRKLNNLTGLSSTIYIRNRRLLTAQNLLLTTDKSITAIESECGFNTVGHMGRLFRTELGCSPSEFRKRR